VWIQLPGGAVVVDTPGVSEIAGGFFSPTLLDDVYPDIASAAQDCRFRDCRHGAEPDCAVRVAIEAGRVRSSRLDSYHRLIAELDRR
jgi:ribosome biogenesis GTPase